MDLALQSFGGQGDGRSSRQRAVAHLCKASADKAADEAADSKQQAANSGQVGMLACLEITDYRQNTHVSRSPIAIYLKYLVSVRAECYFYTINNILII